MRDSPQCLNSQVRAGDGGHMPELKWKLWLGVIFAIALFARVDYVIHAVVYGPIRSDAAQYYACAWNLVHHSTFSTSPPDSTGVSPDSFRDPGFPALIAFWLWVAPDDDHWYAGLLLTHALLGALTVLFWMLLGSRWQQSRVALSAGLIAALWPHNIVQSGYMLSETLTGFLLSYGLWLLTRAGSARALAASGLTLGLAALSNSVFGPLPIVVALVERHKQRWSAKWIAAFLVAALSLPLAWMARGITLPAQDHSANSRLLVNLIQGSHPEFLESYHAARVQSDPAALKTLDDVAEEQNAALRSPLSGIKGALTRMSHSPLRYLKWYFVDKPRALWAWALPTGQGDLYQYPTMHSPFEERSSWRVAAAVAHGLNAPLGILMLMAILLTFTGRLPITSSSSGTAQTQAAAQARDVSVLLVCYVTFLYSLLQTEPRYVIAIRGAEFVLAMASAVAIGRKVLARLRREPRHNDLSSG